MFIDYGEKKFITKNIILSLIYYTTYSIINIHILLTTFCVFIDLGFMKLLQ